MISRSYLFRSSFILSVAFSICGCGPTPLSDEESARLVQRMINEDRELRKMDDFCTESLPALGAQVAVKDLTKGKSGPLITYRIKSSSSKENAFELFDRHFEDLNWKRSGVAELPLTSVADYTDGEYSIALSHGYFGLDANFAIDCRLLRAYTK